MPNSLHRLRRSAFTGVSGLALLTVVACGGASTTGETTPSSRRSRLELTSLLPRATVAAARIDISTLRASAYYGVFWESALRDELNREGRALLKAVLDQTHTMVLGVAPTADLREEPAFIVIIEGTYTRGELDALGAAMRDGGAPVALRDTRYYLVSGGRAPTGLLRLDDERWMIAPIADFEASLDRARGAGGSVRDVAGFIAMARATDFDSPGSFRGVAYLEVGLRAFLARDLPRSLPAGRDLLMATRGAGLRLEVSDGGRANLTLVVESPEAAIVGAQEIRSQLGAIASSPLLQLNAGLPDAVRSIVVEARESKIVIDAAIPDALVRALITLIVLGDSTTDRAQP